MLQLNQPKNAKFRSKDGHADTYTHIYTYTLCTYQISHLAKLNKHANNSNLRENLTNLT